MTSNIAEIQFQRMYTLTEVPKEITDTIQVIEPRVDVNHLFISQSTVYRQRFKYDSSVLQEFAMRTIQEIVSNSALWRLFSVDARVTEAEIKTDETIGARGWFGGKRFLLRTKTEPEKISVAGVIQYEPEVAEQDVQKHLEALQSQGYQCVTKTFEQIQNEKIGRLERQVRELEGDTKYDGHDYLA